MHELSSSPIRLDARTVTTAVAERKWLVRSTVLESTKSSLDHALLSVLSCHIYQFNLQCGWLHITQRDEYLEFKQYD